MIPEPPGQARFHFGFVQETEFRFPAHGGLDKRRVVAGGRRRPYVAQ